MPSPRTLNSFGPGPAIQEFPDGTFREGSVRTGTPRSMYTSQWNAAKARLAELEAKRPDVLSAAKAAQAHYNSTVKVRDGLTSALARADTELETAQRAHEVAAATAFMVGKPGDPFSGVKVAHLQAVVTGLRRTVDEDVDHGARSRFADAENALESLDRSIEGTRQYFKQRPDPARINWDSGTHHVGSDGSVAVLITGDGG